MSVYLGNTKIGQIYLGSTEIAQAYFGSTKVWEASSPLPYDAEVEYLQSSGTQYILTDISITTNFKCEAKGQFLSGNGNYRPMVGAYESNGSKFGNVISLGNTSSGKLYSQIGGSSSYATSNNTSYTGEHTFITTLKNSLLTFYVDGTSVQKNYSGTYSSLPLCLFGQNRGTEVYYSYVQIKYVKMWNSETLVFDGIPVRVGQVGYIYDRISGDLLGNDGSGNFNFGNDKS